MYKIKQLGMQTLMLKYRPLGYERVYLPLCKVADTPFHIQGCLGFSANLFLQVFLNLALAVVVWLVVELTVPLLTYRNLTCASLCVIAVVLCSLCWVRGRREAAGLLGIAAPPSSSLLLQQNGASPDQTATVS